MRVRGKAVNTSRREDWSEESGSPPTQKHVFVSRDEEKTVARETPACKLSYVTLISWSNVFSWLVPPKNEST